MKWIRAMALCLALLTCLTIPAAWASETEEEDPLAQRLADAQNDIMMRKVGKYGMVPIYGRDVADGTYDVYVDSSSPYFHIAKATLTVEDGEMTARFTIPSMSYRYV